MVLMEYFGLAPSSTLVLAFLTLFAAALVVYGIGHLAGKYTGWIAALASLISTLLILDIVIPASTTSVLAGPYKWIPGFLNVGLYADGLSYPIVLMISALGTITLFYSAIDMKESESPRAYYGNMLLFIGGMIGVVLSTNLIEFILFWEVMLLPSFIIISMFGVTEERKISALKYFLYTHFGSAFLFAGVFIIGFLTSPHMLDPLDCPFDLSTIGAAMPAMLSVALGALLGAALMILVAFAVKMAIFPLHTWLPSAYYDAPIPATLLLSSAMTKTAAYGIVRILILLLAPQLIDWRLGLMIVALITMYYGGILALAQDNLKSMLAYSSMSQMGYILFGLATLTLYGGLGGVFHIINHGIAIAVMWLTCGILLKQAGTFEYNKLRGLGAKMPLTAMCAVIAGLSLAGTPPLAGFQSELLIFLGGTIYPALVLLAIIATALTAGYYLWAIRRIFFGPLKSGLRGVEEAPKKVQILLLILTVFIVVFGIIPNLILGVINPILATVLH
jgi:NADH-quinone oxidoreductase subunit M